MRILEKYGIFLNSFYLNVKRFIRSLKRIEDKIGRLKVSITFNQTCLEEKIMPIYIYIYIDIDIEREREWTHTYTHTHVYIKSKKRWQIGIFVYNYLLFHIYIYIYIYIYIFVCVCVYVCVCVCVHVMTDTSLRLACWQHDQVKKVLCFIKFQNPLKMQTQLFTVSTSQSDYLKTVSIKKHHLQNRSMNSVSKSKVSIYIKEHLIRAATMFFELTSSEKIIET